jgi:hypothetical protein
MTKLGFNEQVNSLIIYSYKTEDKLENKINYNNQIKLPVNIEKIKWNPAFREQFQEFKKIKLDILGKYSKE